VLYALVFMEIGSRRVVFANCTAHPDAEWTVQQMRNVIWEAQELGLPIKFLIRDRDSKFTAAFDTVASAAGITVLRTPYRAPNANAFLERLLGSVRREALDWLIILNERHLLAVLREYFDHYNHARPHRGLDLRVPVPPTVPKSTGSIVRRQRLHGIINEYSRAA